MALINAVQFLENNGGGSFKTSPPTPFGYQTVSMPPYQPIIADYDFDGRRDIFISGPSFEGDHQSTSILFQNENGQFTDTGRSILSASVADMGVWRRPRWAPTINGTSFIPTVRWRTGRFRNINDRYMSIA